MKGTKGTKVNMKFNKDYSVRINLSIAKMAVEFMIKYWANWKKTNKLDDQLECIANYTAAFTICKVYLENFLKHLYPNERSMPLNIARDVRNIVMDMDAIEKVNNKMLKKAIRNIDQLKRDAA